MARSARARVDARVMLGLLMADGSFAKLGIFEFSCSGLGFGWFIVGSR